MKTLLALFFLAFPAAGAFGGQPVLSGQNAPITATKAIAKSPCPTYASVEPGTTHPKALYSPEPSYTDAARKNKLSGNVVLFVKIGANGQVEHVCVARSLRADLDDSAVRTVKTWRFEPGRRNDVAVVTTTLVEIGFHLY